MPTFSLTHTHKGREGDIQKHFCLREKQRQRDRETYDSHYTDGGNLNAFSKIWMEKSMLTCPTFSSTQLCLIAHSWKHYLTSKYYTKGRQMAQWSRALIALLEDTCSYPSTHVRQLTTAASRGSNALFWPLLTPATQRHIQSSTGQTKGTEQTLEVNPCPDNHAFQGRWWGHAWDSHPNSAEDYPQTEEGN